MNQNIIIQEGGIDYQFTAAKLKTNKVGGGTCLWVPENEVSLGTKHITANGTYTATSDGKYGYSQVSVNVPGAAGSANPDGTPTTNPNIGGGTVDPGTIDPGTGGGGTIDPGSVDPGTGGGTDPGTVDPGTVDPGTVDPGTSGGSTWIPPGGPGSSVVGTDPEDGNEYFIGIDENGGIVKTKIPSGIEIAKAPNKISYTEGETIDYSGIIVILKGGDSAIFSNARYPNGRIPISELTFPVTAAIGGVGMGGQSSISITASDGKWSRNCTISGPGIISAMKQPDGHVSPISVSRTFEGAKITIVDNTYPYYNSVREPSQITIDGIVYYSYWGYGFIDGSPCYAEPSSLEEAVRLLLPFLDHEDNQIPVKWTSPYDGRTFEDTFEITVTGGSSGTTSDTGGTTGDTSSGSGFSDDSGGSYSGG